MEVNFTQTTTTPIFEVSFISFLPIIAVIAILVLFFTKKLTSKLSIVGLWVSVAVMIVDFASYARKTINYIQLLKDIGLDGMVGSTIFYMVIEVLPVTFLLITAIEMTKGLDDNFTRVMACLAVATLSLANIGYLGVILVTLSFVAGIRAKKENKDIKQGWKTPFVAYATFELVSIVAMIFLPKLFSDSSFVTELLGIDVYNYSASTFIVTVGWAAMNTFCVYALSRRFIKDE